MLLVEHDMDAVFRIADRITVMVNGEVIASDVPERDPQQPEVQHRLPRRRALSRRLTMLHDRRACNTYYGDSHILRGVTLAAAGRHARSACSAATAWARRR